MSAAMAITPAPSTEPESNLLRLPAEIRLMIYEILCEGLHWEIGRISICLEGPSGSQAAVNEARQAPVMMRTVRLGESWTYPPTSLPAFFNVTRLVDAISAPWNLSISCRQLRLELQPMLYRVYNSGTMVFNRITLEEQWRLKDFLAPRLPGYYRRYYRSEGFGELYIMGPYPDNVPLMPWSWDEDGGPRVSRVEYRSEEEDQHFFYDSLTAKALGSPL